MSVKQIFHSENPQQLLQEFFAANDYFTQDQIKQITKAWDFLVSCTSSETRSSGEPYYIHPLRVAHILAQNKLDSETIVAALLHSINQHGATSEKVNELFGQTIAGITDTTNKILNIPINTKSIHQSDAIRKMFFAMSDDVRVLFITLADRLDRMRNIKNLRREYQVIIAEAAIGVWAPLVMKKTELWLK